MAATRGRTSPYMTPKQLQTELLRCEYCEEKPCTGRVPGELLAFRFHHGGTRVVARRTSAAQPGKSCATIPWAACADWCARIVFAWPPVPARNLMAPSISRKCRPRLSTLREQNGGLPTFSACHTQTQEGGCLGRWTRRIGEPRLPSPKWDMKLRFWRRNPDLGGMLRLIPADRLDQRVVQADIDFVLSLGAISFRLDSPDP